MARDVASYHSHSDILTLLVEMDPIRCMVARDTKKLVVATRKKSQQLTKHIQGINEPHT